MTQTNQQNVPELRFPGFSEKYQRTTLNECEPIVHGDGNWILSENISDDGRYQVVQLGNIGLGEYVSKDLKRISQMDFEKVRGTLLEKGDLLINRMVDHSVYCCIFDKSGDFITSVDVCWIRKCSDFSNHYLMYQLVSPNAQKKLLSISSGSGRVRISKNNLFSELSIFLPPLPEQRKISSFFSAVDTKIAQLSEKGRLLEEYKRGCMQQLFSKITRFKGDNKNDFPDWEEKRLEEVAMRIRQKNNSLLIRDVLTNSAVHGIISQGDYFDHDVANAENLDRYTIVQTGDFVYNPRISATAPVGPIKRNKLKVGVMSPLYDVFRFHKDENLDFWEQYFNTTQWYKYMKQVANYGARHDRMAISSNDFIAMPLPYLHPDEQKKIADFLMAIDKKISLVNQELELAQSFKKGLLQQMFV